MQEKLAQLRAFHRAEGRVPSYAEMMQLFGYKSRNAVHWLMRKLEAYGYARRSGPRRIVFTDKLIGNVRVLGKVEAGFPSPAEEELVDILSLDEFLIAKPEATFMLTVSGDSMIEAGIQPGDIVLVEKGRTPKKNDIVVAQVDGEWTLKYFVRDRKGVRLEPANSKYKPIIPQQSLQIGGVVTAVIRKYQ
jgi:repressor LexA